jgi:hypothetical protein
VNVLSETVLDRLRPTKIWKTMSQERRIEAARAFWADEQSAEQQAEAVLAIASHLKFRPKSAASLPIDRRARYLANLPAIPETVAARLLVAWHLERQRAMMSAFLDTLGIAHDNGLITEDIKPPDAERLAAAAKDLASRHPADDVKLYFSALLSQDPDSWEGLAEYVAGPA